MHVLCWDLAVVKLWPSTSALRAESEVLAREYDVWVGKDFLNEMKKS